MTETHSATRLGPALWDKVPGKWNPETDETLVCCYVRDETHDVKSFLFGTRNPSQFRFQPGQFITLDLEIDGTPVNRCYTISSPPTRPDTISITVKRQPGGIVSNWLHEHVKPGVEIKALGPAGEFTCASSTSQKYLFLSGGSGVTPLMSMSRTLYDLGEDKDIVFVHSARTPNDIIFRRELAAMSSGMKNFRTAFVCENPGTDASFDGHSGFLTLQLLREITRDFAQREIFCCGPAPYMSAVRGILQGIGFGMSHYHEESFTFGESAANSVAVSTVAVKPAPAAEGAFQIEFTKSGQTISCGPDQFILDAAREAGMRLPFSCSKGLCGTCKSKKISGEVVMSHGGGIRQREIDAGMILICCSKPLGNVTIEK